MEFFVGILPEDTSKLLSLFKELEILIKHEYDDPDGYYTYIIDGNWEQYAVLLNQTRFVKSLTHYEE